MRQDRCGLFDRIQQQRLIVDARARRDLRADRTIIVIEEDEVSEDDGKHRAGVMSASVNR